MVKLYFILALYALTAATHLLPVHGKATEKPSPIVYKYVYAYKQMWNDRGSGSRKDVSIWRPVDNENGFFPLGDTASQWYKKPKIPAMTVSSAVEGALAAPISYKTVWTDRGSGARKDVKIVRLIPPTGYTCLGDVAVNSYKRKPKLSLYRCVKSEYVETNAGTYDFIWNDRGSGARKDVSLYRNTNEGSSEGRDANTFKARGKYRRPSGGPNLLRESASEEKSPLHNTLADKAFVVYQVTDSKRIWNDAGSGARKDFSIWRAKNIPENYYSLGDYAVRSHSRPRFIVMVKPLKEDALAEPTSFRFVWNDRGSGAKRDVTIYKPICPPRYQALGHIAVGSYRRRPKKRDIRCVNKKYIVEGKWKKVWKDKGSGAKKDVTAYRALPSTSSGQGIRAMGARSCYCRMRNKAYVLNSSMTQYIVSKPVKQYIIENLEYNLNHKKILQQSPQLLANTVLINKGTTEQTVTRVPTYTYEETNSWTHRVGVEIGVTVKVEGGPPTFKKSLEVSVKASYSYTTGGSEKESKSDQVRMSVKVKPQSKKTAVITGTRYVMSVPYTADLTPVYADGTKGKKRSYQGTYEGVQVHDIKVVYEKDVPLKN